MENYIMLDGKKFEMEDSLVELLRGVVSEKEEEEEESPFAQVYDKPYYFITSCGTIDVVNDSNSFTDDNRHRVANYCADEELMRQRALHETLNRLLWSYREEWDKDSPWDGHHQHWYIAKSETGKITVEWTLRNKAQGAVYFSLADNAVDAIEEVIKPFMIDYPDFVW